MGLGLGLVVRYARLFFIAQAQMGLAEIRVRYVE